MVKYESQIRQQRLEENRKRMEQHLPRLSRALKNSSSPKTSPTKKIKPRVARTELLPVRRSERFSSKQVTKYQETKKGSARQRKQRNWNHPSFVRSMLPYHVSGGFWLGLSSDFSKRKLPRNDGVISLIDEEGEEWPVIYLSRKLGLSGGWKKFAVDHHLVDGDALVFPANSTYCSKGVYNKGGEL